MIFINFYTIKYFYIYEIILWYQIYKKNIKILDTSPHQKSPSLPPHNFSDAELF